MNCDRFRKQLIEFGAMPIPGEDVPAETLAHLDTCAACAALFQRQRRLETGLQQIAATQAEWSASPRVEAVLLERFHSQSRIEPLAAANETRLPFLLRFRVPAWAAGGVLAAALVLVMVSRVPHPSHTAAAKAISQVAETEDDSDLDNGFVMLPYFANSGEVADTAEDDVVRVVMPRSALVTLGVPVSDDGGSGTVEAELLLGQGGVPQAVRVLE
jgi:hypothetical protein